MDKEIEGIVEIGSKPIVERRATATGLLNLTQSSSEAIQNKMVKKGDVLEANKLRSNLSDFKRLSGAAGTKGQNTISQATTTFNAIYPASTKDTGTFQKEDGSNYPWDEYFNDWKQSWFVTVMENGEKRQKPGFLTLIDREPAVASTNTALSNAIEILRTDVAKGSEWANASVIAFVKRYGSENLPADLRGLLPDE